MMNILWGTTYKYTHILISFLNDHGHISYSNHGCLIKAKELEYRSSDINFPITWVVLKML